MVWLVAQDVTLPDGSHQTVLVPTVYLAQANTVDLTHSGALVAGNSVNLNASGDVINSGHVSSNLATTIIGNNVVNTGIIGSKGTTAVIAVQDVRNTSGRIGGNDVLVQAGRDVINETQTYGVSTDFTNGRLTGRVTGTGVDAIGTISATNNAAVIAGRDVQLNGATIQAGGKAAIAAGRDLNVGTTDITSTRHMDSGTGSDFSHEAVTQQLGSAIIAGGNLATLSGRDTTLTGATISAGGDASMLAGRDMTVTASKDTATKQQQALEDKTSQYVGSSYDEQVNGSSVAAKGNVMLAAGQTGNGNLSVLGSNVSADKGGVVLESTGDVTLGSVSETHDSQSWSHSNRSGFASKDTATDTSQAHQVIATGSTVSGDTVTGAAGHDMTISGSTVAATNDVSLSAANNLTIDTSKDTSQSSSFHEETHSGFGYAGGAGISYGNGSQKDTSNDQSVKNNASLIGSTDGSVHLSAGNDLHVKGSDLIAAKDVTGTGANVVIDTATDTAHHDEQHEAKQSGFTLAIKSPVIDAIENTVDQARAAGDSKDDRAAALHGIASASGAYDSFNAAKGAAAAMSAGKKPEAKIELSYGSSHSESSETSDSTTSRGSNVTAGGTVTFGDYAESKYQDAKNAGDAAGMEAWREGGTSRAELQAAGAAVVGGLGTGGIGGAAAGAAGAAIASLSAGKLDELSKSIADSSPTGNADLDATLGNIVANVIATGMGAAVGGGAGATAGSAVDRFNRQLHPDEYKKAENYAKDVAKQLGISEGEAEGRIVAEMLRNSDKQTADASGGVHDYEVRAVLGCQNLNCNGYKSDPHYADNSYNSQYIADNQAANLMGRTQLDTGKTPKQLADANYDKDPYGNTIARAGATILAGSVAGGAAAGTVLADLATAWSTGTAFTYMGDAISYRSGLSGDQPSYQNAAAAGGIAAAFAPLALPLNTLGGSMAAKSAVSIYNALVAGTGAYGTTAILSPSSNPDLAAGIGVGTGVTGRFAQDLVPGPMGAALGYLFQIVPGPMQAAIENSKNARPKK